MARSSSAAWRRWYWTARYPITPYQTRHTRPIEASSHSTSCSFERLTAMLIRYARLVASRSDVPRPCSDGHLLVIRQSNRHPHLTHAGGRRLLAGLVGQDVRVT